MAELDQDMKALDQTAGERFVAYHADCVDLLSSMPSGSVDFSVYSPPFSNLYVYSDSERDMGNSANDDEFFTQYAFAINDLFRVTKPGRLSAVHVSDLPAFKHTHGAVGLRDFSGETIKAHQKAGWIYHSRVTVWKDPVVEMQRTKAIGLLHKQLIKDSTMSRVGMPDYVLVFRKPGKNAEPVGQDREHMPVTLWQKWASPVWMDIRQGNVLDVRSARLPQDEKHLVPLQLDLIERAVVLWSNPGDVVLSPFMGVGSEGVVALKRNRRYIGIELKMSYYQQAVRHLTDAENSRATLFTAVA